MRKLLKNLGSGERHTFVGTFGGVGFKRSYGGQMNPVYLPTLVLEDVTYDSEIVTNHLWFNYGKQFIKLGELSKGDKIMFDGRVSSYRKGIGPNKKKDFKIERPTKVSLVGNSGQHKAMPDLDNNKNVLIGYIMLTNKDFYLKNGRPYESWYVDKYNDWLRENNK